MLAKQVIKTGYEIVQSSKQSVVFMNNNKMFAVSEEFTGLSVCRVIKNGPDFQFLPGAKSGKSFRIVKNFVNARS